MHDVRKNSSYEKNRRKGAKVSTQKLSWIGMMIAMAFVLSYIESLVPISLGIPGIKLGLSNLVVMCSLYQFNPIIVFFIAIARIILSGITFGNFYSMLYSMAGGMLSFFVMLFFKKTNRFSVYGVSVIGGVCHNIGQIAVAMVVLQTSMLVYYLPFLLLAGSVAGIAIGAISGIMIRRLAPIFFIE